MPRLTRGKRKDVTDSLSSDEVTPRAKPRPRKKQAVTKTKSAAVKALIRKNAATSPLLLLPPEVRENILIHLVGGNFIHLKYLDVYDLWHAIAAKNKHLNIGAGPSNASERSPSYDMFQSSESRSYDMLQSSDIDDGDIEVVASLTADPTTPSVGDHIDGPAFRHAICVSNQSEQSAYEEAVSGVAVVPDGESPEHYIASCKERHTACRMCGNGPMFLLQEDQRTLRVDLKVLGVCRQLYEEANHLLWATNTFSFEDPRTFGKFFSSLNPAQKRNLTSIHISADIGGLGSHYYTSAYQRARWDNDYWGKGLKHSNLNMLRGVQVIHLCINQGLECVSGRGVDPAVAGKVIEKAQQADMESILRLRALSVKHVTVIVSDDAKKLENSGASAHRWTVIEKNAYAENIREQLVDPRGADLAKTESEAANLAKKRETRDKAAARVKSYKSILKNRRADTVRTTKLANREEANALQAAQKANQVLNKSSKKAAKLQDAAERQQARAVDARGTADTMVNKEMYWQEQLSNAREKYNRASALLGVDPEDTEDEEEAETLMEGSSDSDMDLTEDGMTQAHGSVYSEDE